MAFLFCVVMNWLLVVYYPFYFCTGRNSTYTSFFFLAVLFSSEEYMLCSGSGSPLKEPTTASDMAVARMDCPSLLHASR